jgi:hypothetical protein
MAVRTAVAAWGAMRDKRRLAWTAFAEDRRIDAEQYPKHKVAAGRKKGAEPDVDSAR